MTSLSPPGTDAERFRLAIADAMGLRFEDDKLPWLENLLEERVVATRASDARAYLGRLAPGPDRDTEVAALARELCVGETYFFRDTDQFRVIEALVDRWRRAGEGPLRVLSAGCSTGAEAYSIAITALEVAPDRAEQGVVIHGVDVSPRAVETARTAEYTSWALRATPDAMRQKYFVPRGQRMVLDDRVRRMVTFERRNLAEDDPSFWAPRRFDLVCCRNVLMYLTPEAARRAVGRIARSMVPGGWLFLGHAENLRGVSQAFHLRHTHNTFYYARRRPGATSEPELPAPSRMDHVAPAVAGEIAVGASWVETIQRSADRIAELSKGAVPSRRGEPTTGGHMPRSVPDPRLGLAMKLMREDRFADALALLSEREYDDDPDILLLRAVLLATSGEVDTAEILCRRILASDELNAGAHYVRALCREHRGDHPGAMEHDQTAAYLDRDFAMPHLHLGLLSRRAGDLATARRELDLALDLLGREQAPRIVLFGGGFSREGLMHLCRAELRACGGDR